MDTQAVTISQVPPKVDSPSGSSSKPDSSSGRYHHAASPTTGQTRPRSAPKLQNGATETQLQEEAGLSDGDQARTGTSVVPIDLYPLSGFLRSLLDQEKALWERNEILLKSLKNDPSKEGTGLDSLSGTSLHSDLTSATATTGGKQGEDTDRGREPFHFIRYGQMTNTVHKYFRRLEKRHSCLHLTARRAKHETIRHVERTVGGNRPEEPPLSSSLVHQAEAAGSNQAVILRDDELVVYRCALMCSQFPMLSAPNPPDGQSPTPSPPPLPSVFATSMLQYSQTAPSGGGGGGGGMQVSTEVDVHESNGDAGPRSTGRPGLASLSSSGTITSSMAVSTDAVDGGMKQADSARLTRNSSAAASDPIPIKGTRTRNKSRSIKRHSTLASETSNASSLAKLPPGDSDEEAELVKLVNTKMSSGSESSPTGREHPFSPMVNREMLYSLVRQAFKQSEEQQVNFESSLKREYGRRSKGEILAKELAGQLQVLDNNAHPFYKPKLFVTRNGYDLWLQGEKERVKKLIDKFWHCSLPRPQLWRNFNPTDYHRLYTILLRKIVDCESRTDRKEPVHSGRTPSSPLSPTARRLLTEFGLRYGVGDLYRRIVYLEYLAKHFDYEIWYIKHCTEELRSIRTLLPRNRNRVTAVRPEMEILRATIHLLHGQVDNSLTRVDRLFLDSDPRKGVASLIELLAEVLDAQQNLFGKRTQTMEKWLKRYLKSGFVLRYERRKEIASDETMISPHTVQPFVLTPTLVNSLLLGTRDEVYEFRDKYQSVFRPYFDVVPFSKVEFYRLLCADACSLCARKLHKEGNRKTISLEMLGLMYRLNERDIEWQGVIEPEHQLWRHHYQNMACVWLDILGQQISKWTVASVEKDKWTLLAFDASYPSTPSMVTSLSRMPGGHAPSSSWQRGSTRNTHIMSSVRISPFPSPAPSNPNGEAPFNYTGGIGGRRGAFTPYQQIVKRQKSSPILSESSGAITDSLRTGGSPYMDTSSSTSIAGEMPRFLCGNTKKSSPVSIVTFGPRKGHNAIPSHEVEVSVSVYSDELDEEVARLARSHRGESVDRGGSDDRREEMEPVGEEPEGVEPAGREGNTVSHSSSEYATCASEMSGSSQAQQEVDSGSHTYLSAKSLTPGRSEVSLASTVTGLPSEDQATLSSEMNGSTGQIPAVEQPLDVSGKVQATPQAMPKASPPRSEFTKFHNLLDKCDASDSPVMKPKGVVKPVALPGGPPGDQPHPPSAKSVSQLSTVSSAAIDPPPISPPPPPISPPSSVNGPVKVEDLHDSISSPEVSPSPLDGQNEDLGPLQPFLFPVSNSPVDLVTMLSRLAAFTGELLAVLTPKIRKTGFTRGNGKSISTDGYAPEVTKARQQASERLKDAKNIKAAFLKKLNRVFINSLKLYADNLLCMDLCGWASVEASKLLGEPELHHLNRRKEVGEIWGCRHMVEAKHGLHPNGIPCSKKHSERFEHITRDMCIRINNIHILITTFHSLESHLYSMIRTDSQKPISAFSYISSDPSEATPNIRLLRSKTNKPHPTRTRLDPRSNMSPFSDRRDTNSLPSSVSTGLGALEPDQQTPREADDLPPAQSLECLAYLKKVQNFQVKMIAIRMNKFCKMALSELLGLKLGDCLIGKRLFPVVDYLERHRVALQKYIYPECFCAIMEHVWERLLQDLEDEALKLRQSRRPVTDRAQMLLQALAHLIKFMHNKNNGLDIDRLNSTSEYLQGVLDIMTRSSDQLISIFNKLNNAHFNRNVLDLSQAPVVVDSRVLSQLRQQLRSNKKCFTGEEFVGKVMEIGLGALAESVEDRDGTAHVQSPTGQYIEYNRDYATSVAQYLLDEGILIHVTQIQFQSDGSSILLTPEQISDDSDPANQIGSGSYEGGRELSDSVRPLGVSSAVSFVSGAQSAVSFADSPRQSQLSRQSIGAGRANSTLSQDTLNSTIPDEHSSRTRHYQYGQNSTGRRFQRQCSDRPIFSAEGNTYYKFAGSEDEFFQSQILMSSVHLGSHSNSFVGPIGGEDVHLSSRLSDTGSSQEFMTARVGTLCLVYDLLSQRARKERGAKQFINSPRVQEQRRQAGAVNCDLIFKM